MKPILCQLPDRKLHRNAETHRRLPQFGRHRRERLRAADHCKRLAIERRMTRRPRKTAAQHLPASAKRKAQARGALFAGRFRAGWILLEALQMRGHELIIGRERRR